MHDTDLLSYIPEILRDIREYRALLSGDETEVDALWEFVSNALDDQFVLTASENGISRIESILGITPKATYDLEDRRFTVQSKLSNELPYTYRKLFAQLTQLCGEDGFTADIDNGLYTLTVEVELDRQNQFDDVEKLVKAEVPSNLIVNIILKYNKHTMLTSFKHGELEALTYEGVRETRDIEKSPFTPSSSASTALHGLFKPGTSDKYSIEVVNQNLTTIESVLSRKYMLDIYASSVIAGSTMSVESYSPHEITLRWSDYVDAIGYSIYVYSNGRFREYSDTSECSCVISGDLPSGRAFAIRAYGADGFLTDYLPVFVTTDVGSTFIRGLCSYCIGSDTAKLSWAPTNGAQRYRLYKKNGTVWTQYGSDVWGLSTTFSGLSAASDYSFAIRAIASDESFLTAYTSVSLTTPRYTPVSMVSDIMAVCGERYDITAVAGSNRIGVAEPNTDYVITCAGESKAITTPNNYGNISTTFYPPNETLENNDWETIADAAESGSATDLWSVGDEKTLTLLDGTELTVQIYGFSHDTIAGSTQTAGITFGLKYLIMPNLPLSDELSYFYNGGFMHCDLCRYLQNMIFPLLPDRLRDRVKLVSKKNSVSDGSDNAYMISEQAVKLFIPARNEIFLANGISMYSDEGTQYAIFGADASRIRKKTQDGEAVKWLTRTNSSSSSTDSNNVLSRAANAHIVTESGTAGVSESINTGYGVNFLFCI